MKVKLYSCLTILILLGIGIIAVPIFLLSLCLQSDPLVIQGERLALDDIERIKQILTKNNPRRLQSGEIKNIALTQRDLNLFLIHALTYIPHNERFSGRVNLQTDSARGGLTVGLPKNLFGSYLNVSLVLTTSADKVVVDDLDVGALAVPNWLVYTLARFSHRFLLRRQDYRELVEGLNYVKRIEIGENELVLAYQWEPDLADRLENHGRDLLLSDVERERLAAYHRKISEISHKLNGREPSLAEFLQPLAMLAEKRSSVDDPIAENRALILTAAVYVMRRNLHRITGPDKSSEYKPPRYLKVSILERHDLAQHFIISAALAASANSNTANVIGLFKEIDDSRGGSGFSFADLAADRAGVKLAEVATRSVESAKQLQHQMKEHLAESDFMPTIDQLPEGITEHEFKREYQDLESEIYQLVDIEIDRRITACRLYQEDSKRITERNNKNSED